MKTPASCVIGANTKDSSVSAGSAEAGGPSWQPLESAPYGIPVNVRDAAGGCAVAIRDYHCAWYNEARSGRLELLPVEWSPV